MTVNKRSIIIDFASQKGWIYALLIAVGVGLGVYQISNHQIVSRFAVEGLDSLGLVTNKSEYMTKGNKKYYRLSYTFPTPDEPYNHGRQNVSESFYNAKTEEAEIVVRYLSTEPSINAVELSEIDKGFWVGLLVSIGLVFGGFAGCAYALYLALKAAP